MAARFRGFLPVVIDVETGGFNAKTDALLELAAVTLTIDTDGIIKPEKTFSYAINPFPGANLEKAALDFTGIDPKDPLRRAQHEDTALNDLFQHVRRSIRAHQCNRAVIVAHNAHFDHGFVMAAAERCNIKRNPFHPFSCFDTVTLSGLAFGQTVLAKTCQQAGIEFSNSKAHSAKYDAEKTAELFCLIVNRWQKLGGFSFE
ncbi:MAG: ribonuclease T [Pseudomonadales bacterium]|nr:ribonuclease T [Pseudomonadales bacterium]